MPSGVLPVLFLSGAIVAVFLPMSFCNDGDGDGDATVSKVNPVKHSLAKERRFLLYGENFGEGFNLRRDVYMRMANLVRVLREKGHNFVLVLPPWGQLYHWQSRELGQQTKIPWKLFFDVPSLNEFVPVVEFDDFLNEVGRPEIDHVLYLQNYAEGWGGKWEEKWHYRPCIEARGYTKEESTGLWRAWFFGYEKVIAKRFDCISIQGHASTLLPIILQPNQTATSIMIDRAETVMHDNFGDKYYWQARRSMRYNKDLVALADDYRLAQLNSDDERDQTQLAADWRQTKTKHGQATGGPYLCVHWRRKDFLNAHGKELPSIAGTAKQVQDLLHKLQLDMLFVATDAPNSEVQQLQDLLPANVTLKRFVPPKPILEQYKDGGVSIIDQWICAHARYFVGSHVSTFSFRIQDDREIIGFAPDTTFNRLCPDGVDDCEQPAQWKIVY